jgi:hypothetical protein
LSDARPIPPADLPRGVRWAVAFFLASGALEVGLTLAELPRPLGFWPVWQALGNGLLYVLLAAGLHGRFAICRSLAMVYCLATLATFAAVLAMALARAPLAFPFSLYLASLLQVPSCALLLPYLRSREAALFLGRPLL